MEVRDEGAAPTRRVIMSMQFNPINRDILCSSKRCNVFEKEVGNVGIGKAEFDSGLIIQSRLTRFYNI